MDRWEYHATLLYADSGRVDAFLAERFPGWQPDRHSPEALIPALNALGAEGWELASLQPVYPGFHSDIAHGMSGQAQWSAWYLAAFRRRLPTTAGEPPGARPENARPATDELGSTARRAASSRRHKGSTTSN